MKVLDRASLSAVALSGYSCLQLTQTNSGSAIQFQFHAKGPSPRSQTELDTSLGPSLLRQTDLNPERRDVKHELNHTPRALPLPPS